MKSFQIFIDNETEEKLDKIKKHLLFIDSKTNVEFFKNLVNHIYDKLELGGNDNGK